MKSGLRVCSEFLVAVSREFTAAVVADYTHLVFASKRNNKTDTIATHRHFRDAVFVNRHS